MSWRNTREYRIWRASVVRKYKRCVICGNLQHRQAHHLNSGSYFPEERYDVDNGILLCRGCHSMFHNKFMGGTRKKCQKEDFERFKDLLRYTKEIEISEDI